MMSTLVNRTMQSGYSELMGMFHRERSPKLTVHQEKALEPKGVASPPFRVRDQHQINKRLGADALPFGFNQMPIFNRINEDSLEDDLDLPGCEYVNKVDSDKFPSEDTYKNYTYLVDDLREPFTEAFNLN